ncbi:MAG: 7-carboxy-7-deazaguanine synthase QueE [Deltaproteobacteria bacterium]|nr:7-carboxy-7-deazaguanine synthase QueE [Deltaproteobacteria bacterium]
MAQGFLSEIFVSFQGEGIHAGRRQLFVRLAGCNLRCRYCDTPDSLERVPSFRVYDADGGSRELPNPVSPAAALAAALPLLDGEPIDGVAVTGGEPLMQAAFVAELLADARLPRPRLLETNGMLPDPLAEVLPVVDVVSMDIKLPSNSGERAFWEPHARFLDLAADKAYVKVLIDAGTDLAEVERAADLTRNRAPRASLFLQPISAPNGGIDLDAAGLSRFFRAARERHPDVRLLPQAHKALAIQ